MRTMTRRSEPVWWRWDQRLPDLGRNVAIFLVLWTAYAAVRGITAGDIASATQNAATIVDLQRSLGLPDEAAVQQAVIDYSWLLRGANLYYVGAHFPVTIGFLVWAWWRHRTVFRRVRNALIMTTGAGLVVHVMYPLKPPRMMEGFVDTAAVLGPDPYELSISAGANQLAAMPSLHVGWALLVALGVMATGAVGARWFAVVHPTVTFGVVVVTANHYWVDAIVAVVIVVAAWRLTERTERKLDASEEH